MTSLLKERTCTLHIYIGSLKRGQAYRLKEEGNFNVTILIPELKWKTVSPLEYLRGFQSPFP